MQIYIIRMTKINFLIQDSVVLHQAAYEPSLLTSHILYYLYFIQDPDFTDVLIIDKILI